MEDIADETAADQVAKLDKRQFQAEFEFALTRRRPEIPLMRRMSLPMAMEHAKKMVNGESEPEDILIHVVDFLYFFLKS